MKKILKSFILSLIVLSSISFGNVAHAALPGSTVVIGTKAFDLNYANDGANRTEIMQLIISDSTIKIFIKAPNNQWFNNDGSKLPDISLIPAVSYKNYEGQKSYDAGDGNEQSGNTEEELIVDDIY